MSLFTKKQQENEYEKALKEMNQEPVVPSKDRIFFDEITGDDSKTLYYVDKMLKLY